MVCPTVCPTEGWADAQVQSRPCSEHLAVPAPKNPSTLPLPGAARDLSPCRAFKFALHDLDR
jgi:hypothetical protein